MNFVENICTVIVAPPKVKILIFNLIQFFCQGTKSIFFSSLTKNKGKENAWSENPLKQTHQKVNFKNHVLKVYVRFRFK